MMRNSSMLLSLHRVRRLIGARLANELLHLPGEPAGVEQRGESRHLLAGELLHLPDEPAGVCSANFYFLTPPWRWTSHFGRAFRRAATPSFVTFVPLMLSLASFFSAASSRS